MREGIEAQNDFPQATSANGDNHLGGKGLERRSIIKWTFTR